jgi:hypothetical protein
MPSRGGLPIVGGGTSSASPARPGGEKDYACAKASLDEVADLKIDARRNVMAAQPWAGPFLLPQENWRRA